MLYGVYDHNIRNIAGSNMKHLPAINNAFLLIENGVIKDFGTVNDAPERADYLLDAKGGFVLPGWCDSHTHLVFAASRSTEFTDKIRGLSYEEIAQRGGGILNSAEKLAKTDESLLVEQALQRLEEIEKTGTVAVEIKSGYGLTYEAELKMLRVIRTLKQKSKLTIKATFLGAHAYPMAYKENHEPYLQIICNELLPEIAGEGLADFVDVFCEKGYFSVTETNRILESAAKFGLRPKIHVNQFNDIGGIETALKYNALSVDHLEVLSDENIATLKSGNAMPVALPGCSFFLRIPYTPARKVIDAGLPLALASDFNPGSAPSGNMNFVMSLGCIQMRMLPEEVINAATQNGAYAMGVESIHGSITKEKKAALVLTKPLDNIAEIPYYFGSNLIAQTITG